MSERYTVCYALSGKEGGSVALRHDLFATYLPYLLERFAPTLNSNHIYKLSTISKSTSEAR